MANQQLTNSGSKKYIEFDILASSNNKNIYYNGADIHINYATSVFGANNLVTNKKITVTKGLHFCNANDYLIFLADVYSTNSFFISLYSNPSSPNRVILSTTPTVLVHIKIELLPGAIFLNSDLYFTFNSYTGENATYTLTKNAHSTDYYFYDKTFFYGLLPIITTPLNTISKIAGIGDILTIDGYNFGNNKGFILFSEADKGGGFLSGLDNQYYPSNSWSDTQIKVIVPSIVYKGYENEPPSYSSGGAGTGKICVTTATGYFCISETDLKIPYSITNTRMKIGGNIRRAYLARTACNADVMFTLHSDFQNSIHADKIDNIETALKHWSELTGLTLILEKDQNGNYQFENSNNMNKNVIKFDNVPFMRANRYISIRGYNTDSVFYLNIGSNILINQNISWDYKTSGQASIGKYSFYQSFMHELGHILLLNHVIDPTDLMYFQISQAAPIINLTSTSKSVEAVKQNMAASKTIKWETVIPLLPRLYPVGDALKATLLVKNSCYAANSGSITATATGGKPLYTYNWKKNGQPFGGNTYKLENLDVGEYILELKDSQSCTQYYKETIKYFGGSTPLSLNIIKIPATPPNIPELFQGNVSGGVPPYSYKWSPSIKSVSMDPNLPPEQKGDIIIGVSCSLPTEYVTTNQMPTKYLNSTCDLKLTVTDKNGCFISGLPPEKSSNSSAKVEANIENIFIDEISIFPNPTLGTLTISNINDATVCFFSALGGLIKTFEHVINNEIINIDHLSNGIYFLKIIDGNMIRYEKVILNK